MGLPEMVRTNFEKWTRLGFPVGLPRSFDHKLKVVKWGAQKASEGLYCRARSVENYMYTSILVWEKISGNPQPRATSAYQEASAEALLCLTIGMSAYRALQERKRKKTRIKVLYQGDCERDGLTFYKRTVRRSTHLEICRDTE